MLVLFSSTLFPIITKLSQKNQKKRQKLLTLFDFLAVLGKF